MSVVVSSQRAGLGFHYQPISNGGLDNGNDPREGEYAMKLLPFALVLVAQVCSAQTYRVTLTDGSVKVLESKALAVRYILSNEQKIRSVEESRLVELTEKLTFRKRTEGRR